MSGKKGMKQYPSAIKAEIMNKQKDGQSVSSLSNEYGISRYAIQSWCGLRPETKIRELAPQKRGRPRKNSASNEHDLTLENKRLKMENELLRDFLKEVGRS